MVQLVARLKSAHIFICVSCILCIAASTAAAQGQRPAGGNATGGNKPGARPAAPEEQVSPALLKVLQKWEASSKKINSLEGEHERIVYDDVFFTAKRSQGRFYYVAPDKGRIDLLGNRDVKAGTFTTIVDPKTKKEKRYKVQSDRPERWICNGKSIYQINETEKTIDQFEIPPEARGKNIINGPLPFLFGMPVKDTLDRFSMKLMGVDQGGRFWIEAFPKWRQDAASYKSAQIILSNKTYLPSAVRLFDPAGTKTTTFIFNNIQVNKAGSWVKKFFGNADPFQLPQKGYTIIEKKPAQRVPSVVGFYWKDAGKILEKSGYVVKYKQGMKAGNEKFTYVVYNQTPQRFAPLPKGKEVTLTVYLPAAKEKPQRN
ncbi:MAG: hypothetical protein CMJ78_06190 [Planctomycetaceae bacterium]|nr:hypothetical protein [Planctomycetaceae bacterium]